MPIVENIRNTIVKPKSVRRFGRVITGFGSAITRFGMATTHSGNVITWFGNARKRSPSIETRDLRPESAIILDLNRLSRSPEYAHRHRLIAARGREALVWGHTVSKLAQ